jgi:hypothetical protein
MTRLVQIARGGERRIALVEEPRLRLLDGCGSVYELANSAIAAGVKLIMTPSMAGAPSGASFLQWTIPKNRHAVSYQARGSPI